MKLKGIIVDADFCIKIGASPKYHYLERVLAELAIIDRVLNTGIDDIACVRIEDVVRKIKNSELNFTRKEAKVLWRLAGKKTEIFDNSIWPINLE